METIILKYPDELLEVKVVNYDINFVTEAELKTLILL